MRNLFTSTGSMGYMKHADYLVVTIFLVLTAYGSVAQAAPIDNGISKSGAAKSGLLQAYTWYDGDRKRKVWLDPGLMAEFPQGAVETGLIQKKYPDAGMWDIHRNVRIWELDVKSFTSTALKPDETAIQAPFKYSPVFHDAATESASIRALPGNVIVYLNPAWDQDRIRRWMEIRGFEIIKMLNVRPNVYVVKTEPGIEALELANALYESGEVVAAFPDWWLEGVMR